ncbi:MAG: TlpA family protein disulfide reductase [Candidatus Pelagibacter sp.]
MKKLFILIFCLISFQSVASEKKTTFNEEVFNNAQSEGKIVVVSSWIKYCSSCASQMKVLNKAKDDFQNIIYLNFDVRNKEISKLLNVQYQTTLLIFKKNKEIYRSVGETSKSEIYRAIEKSLSNNLSISINSKVSIGS